MKQSVGKNGNRMAFANETIKKVTQLMSPGTEFGLRTFGDKEPRGIDTVDCDASELLVPFTALSKELLAKSRSLNPTGLRPASYALHQAFTSDLAEVTNSKTALVLFLSGHDTCAGNIVDTTKRFRKSNVVIFVVLFQEHLSHGDIEDAQTIGEKLSGGKVYDLSSAKSLPTDLAHWTQ